MIELKSKESRTPSGGCGGKGCGNCGAVMR